MRFIIAIMLAFCVPLTACAPVEAPITTKSTLLDEKAVYAAEATYNAAAYTYLTLLDNGQLSSERKAQIKPKLILAYDTLKALKAAHSVGDSATFEQQLVAFNALVGEVRSLLK